MAKGVKKEGSARKSAGKAQKSSDLANCDCCGCPNCTACFVGLPIGTPVQVTISNAQNLDLTIITEAGQDSDFHRGHDLTPINGTHDMGLLMLDDLVPDVTIVAITPSIINVTAVDFWQNPFDVCTDPPEANPHPSLLIVSVYIALVQDSSGCYGIGLIVNQDK